MADTIAAGVQARTIQQQIEPDGSPLAPLKARTLARKRRLGYPDTIGVETGEMLDMQQIRGMVAMNETELVMEYGLDAEMKELADWFIQGDPGQNRQPRPFYDLDPNILANLDDLCDEAIVDRIHSLGGT